MVTTTLRNAELTDIVQVLRDQRDVRYDVVASSDRIEYRGGLLVVKDGAVSMDADGVSETDAHLTPTTVFEGGVADRLGIPVRYLRRMRETAIAEHDRNAAITEAAFPNPYMDLLDANVNTWLTADPARKFLIRGFLGTGETEGVARAFLSDRYQSYDHLDIILSALDGAKRTGASLDVISADLSERRMRVKVACPEISALAPTLLRNYRSPFDDADPRRAAMLERHGWLRPSDQPVVFAGFVIGNSETGNGLWSITPELTVQICGNGMTQKIDAFGKVHIGGQLDEGLVQWSDETRVKNIELIASQTTDAVTRFISPEYVQAKVDEIEAKAGATIDKPTEVLEKVTKRFKFTDHEADLILADFVSGGQGTAGGILNAVTSAAQRIEDPDRAAEVGDTAMDVLHFVAT
ncbi:MAG TPA: DUF932 domain-containing protein [Acidimicrobiia bacterium]|nr:DUF932 domain-containing protein [Acidimicrobiia bacterium]